MNDNASNRNEPRAEQVDPSDQSGRPFIVSGFMLVLIAVLAVLVVIGILVLG